MRESLKTLGCILIFAGTAIGAGMLALPLTTAAVGFPIAMVLLIICWLVMSLTALLILEANLSFPDGASFNTMARFTLGRGGQVTTWLSFLLLLYALTAAYVSGGSSILSSVIKLISGATWPHWINTLIFTIALGGIVVLGTRSVDFINRGLMAIKGFAFFSIFFLIFPDIKVHHLVSSAQQLPYVWYTLPILITAYGSHTVIPSIRNYIGPDVKRLRLIIVSGCLLPLIIYTCWEIITLGVLPLYGANSFHAIASKHGSINDMVLSLQNIVNKKTIDLGVNIFTDVAITTSFLGVTMSLFDFLADAFRVKSNKFYDRFIIGLLTFTPAVLFALLYPKGFVLALGYASIFCSILLIILPPLMVLNLRRKNKKKVYRTWQTTPVLWVLVIVGVGIIVLQILNSLNMLPVFS
ncbi:MAG: aromatic amino acid transporter [Gammaproteobacteria bacterium]|nr:aromatic amino acid transporter [Gammaproteobacteria bacterium]